MSTFQALFQPGNIRTSRLDNWLVMAAMGLPLVEVEGRVTDQMIASYLSSYGAARTQLSLEKDAPEAARSSRPTLVRLSRCPTLVASTTSASASRPGPFSWPRPA